MKKIVLFILFISIFVPMVHSDFCSENSMSAMEPYNCDLSGDYNQDGIFICFCERDLKICNTNNICKNHYIGEPFDCDINREDKFFLNFNCTCNENCEAIRGERLRKCSVSLDNTGSADEDCDGIGNDADCCLRTAQGEDVDSQGCSCKQKEALNCKENIRDIPSCQNIKEDICCSSCENEFEMVSTDLGFRLAKCTIPEVQAPSIETSTKEQTSSDCSSCLTDYEECNSTICTSIADYCVYENHPIQGKICYAECNNDNIKDNHEQCDGTDLSGKSCADFNFGGGNLLCIDCQYDTSGCTDKNSCEDCGSNCNEATCLAIGDHCSYSSKDGCTSIRCEDCQDVIFGSLNCAESECDLYNDILGNCYYESNTFIGGKCFGLDSSGEHDSQPSQNNDENYVYVDYEVAPYTHWKIILDRKTPDGSTNCEDLCSLNELEFYKDGKKLENSATSGSSGQIAGSDIIDIPNNGFDNGFEAYLYQGIYSIIPHDASFAYAQLHSPRNRGRIPSGQEYYFNQFKDYFEIMDNGQKQKLSHDAWKAFDGTLPDSVNKYDNYAQKRTLCNDAAIEFEVEDGIEADKIILNNGRYSWHNAKVYASEDGEIWDYLGECSCDDPNLKKPYCCKKCELEFDQISHGADISGGYAKQILDEMRYIDPYKTSYWMYDSIRYYDQWGTDWDTSLLDQCRNYRTYQDHWQMEDVKDYIDTYSIYSTDSEDRYVDFYEKINAGVTDIDERLKNNPRKTSQDYNEYLDIMEEYLGTERFNYLRDVMADFQETNLQELIKSRSYYHGSRLKGTDLIDCGTTFKDGKPDRITLGANDKYCYGTGCTPSIRGPKTIYPKTGDIIRVRYERDNYAVDNPPMTTNTHQTRIDYLNNMGGVFGDLNLRQPTEKIQTYTCRENAFDVGSDNSVLYKEEIDWKTKFASDIYSNVATYAYFLETDLQNDQEDKEIPFNNQIFRMQYYFIPDQPIAHYIEQVTTYYYQPIGEVFEDDRFKLYLPPGVVDVDIYPSDAEMVVSKNYKYSIRLGEAPTGLLCDEDMWNIGNKPSSESDFLSIVMDQGAEAVMQSNSGGGGGVHFHLDLDKTIEDEGQYIYVKKCDSNPDNGDFKFIIELYYNPAIVLRSIMEDNG